jgi:hypothetical protein
MALLIDGYNILNAAGIVPPGSGRGSLERSRVALLNFLVEALGPAEAAQTTVVFDARHPPPGLPRRVEHRGLAVRFASQYPDADTLLEELIAADTAPRRLTVVSSDHRVQRAARRRRARAVDSHVWYAELLGRRRVSRPNAPVHPTLPLSQLEVQRWLAEFGSESIEGEVEAGQPAPANPGAGRPAAAAEPDPPGPAPPTVLNPFPPGYGEDLLSEDEA